MKQALLISVGVVWLCLSSAWADPPEVTLYNPQPAEGDKVLPMPDGGHIVFRAAKVAGKGFWAADQRLMQIGDASGGPFEGLQRLQVNGSFPTDDGWEIWLAKYELTRGQFIAVMGLDDYLAASKDPDNAKLRSLKGEALRQAFAMPLSYVSYNDVQRFLQRYNAWLFDPEHSEERLAGLPRNNGAPGFIRLATESEWEYVARGGLPVLQKGAAFNERLPFPPGQLNDYAWHLGNAKHKVRPIGLRQPNPLGFHDLYGNVQEMTAGLFQPELWQGQPGGVPVRGASVSTALADVRASNRAELEIYSWNAEKKRVEERRSFNTGARLAIGANVVVSSQVRASIEQEYQDYHKNTRAQTPVGHTLDNLVTQASTQLDTVDPILRQLMETNPDLRAPLTTVQRYMDTARERLDQAQRESARSLLQDAARNGVNYSVHLSRLEKLRASLVAAQEMLAISTRYQEQVTAVENAIRDTEKAANEQFQAYRDKVAQVGEYRPEYIEQGFKTLQEHTALAREQKVLTLLAEQTQRYAQDRQVNAEQWQLAFTQAFQGFKD